MEGLMIVENFFEKNLRYSCFSEIFSLTSYNRKEINNNILYNNKINLLEISS